MFCRPCTGTLLCAAFGVQSRVTRPMIWIQRWRGPQGRVWNLTTLHSQGKPLRTNCSKNLKHSVNTSYISCKHKTNNFVFSTFFHSRIYFPIILLIFPEYKLLSFTVVQFSQSHISGNTYVFIKFDGKSWWLFLDWFLCLLRACAGRHIAIPKSC